MRSSFVLLLGLAVLFSAPAVDSHAFGFGIGNAIGNQISELKKELDAKATATAEAALPIAGPADTRTITPTFSVSPSTTLTFSISATLTISPTFTPSFSASPSSSASPTASPTATPSPSSSGTPSATDTFSASPSATPSSTSSATPSTTPSATASGTSTPSPTATATYTPGELISSAAGNGSIGSGGDGLVAAGSSIHSAYGVACDADGNVFFSDFNAGRIYKVDTAGWMTIIAGAGSGPDGPAHDAQLSNPSGLAVGPAGELYVAEYGGHRIRKIQNGLISTVAGTGSAGYSGDGSAATSATLNYPLGVAVDGSGDLYIADLYNSAIRKVNGGVISTLATPPYPTGVFYGADAKLYYASNSTLFARDGGGSTTTVAGGIGYGNSGDEGPAVSAALGTIVGIWRDASGRLYLADQGFHRVRMVDGGGKIRAFAGNGSSTYTGDGQPATQAGMNQPSGVGGDAWGNVYIGDFGNHALRKVGAFAVPSPTVTQTLTATPSFSPGFTATDTNSPTQSPTWSASPSVTPTWTVGPSIETFLPVTNAWALISDDAGNLYYNAYNGTRIYKRDTAGVISIVAGNGNLGFSGDGGPATAAAINAPGGMCLSATGDLYFADYGNKRIRRIAADGSISTVAGNGAVGPSGDGGQATVAALSAPGGVALDGAGRLYIAGCGGIRRVDLDGTISTLYGSPYCANQMVALADGTLYFSIESKVFKRTPAGAISVIAGNGVVGAATGDGGPALDAAIRTSFGMVRDSAGVFYISDYEAHMVRAFTEGGSIWRVAGNGSAGYSGDGGEARDAQLNYPYGLGLDSFGNVYIAELHNSDIRVVRQAPVSTPTLTWTHSVTRTMTPSPTATATPSFSASPSATPSPTATPTVTKTNDYGPPINTIAGTGTTGTPIWGNAAATEPLGNLSGLDVSADGQVYFGLNFGSSYVGRVALDGILSHFAINGCPTCSYAGDGGLATAANGAVGDVAQNQDGTQVYIGDSYSSVIRKVDIGSGIITRFAGDPITCCNPVSGGSALSSGLWSPRGMAADSAGAVYFIEAGSHRIRGVTPGGILLNIAGDGSTNAFAGNGSAAASTGFANLGDGLAVGPDDVVYFTDGYYIRKYLPSNGTVWTVAGNGSSTSAGNGVPALSTGMFPSRLAFDSLGNLYFTDSNVIRRMDLAGLVWEVAGGQVPSGFGGDGQPAYLAQIAGPSFLATDSANNLYFWDNGNKRIRKIGANPIPTATPVRSLAVMAGTGSAGFSGDGGAAVTALLNTPSDAVVDSAGNVYFSDYANNRIRRVDSSWNISTYAGDGSGNGGLLYQPTVMTIDTLGAIYVVVSGNSVTRIAPGSTGLSRVAGNGSNGYGGNGGLATSATFDTIKGLAFDSNAGALLISDFASSTVRKAVVGGNVTHFAGTASSFVFSGDGGSAGTASFIGPMGLAMGADGSLYVADNGAYRVRRIDTDGKISTVAGNGSASISGLGGSALLAAINTPQDLAIDASGKVYISNGIDGQVLAFQPGGLIRLYKNMGSPTWGITADAAGTLFGTSASGHQLRRFGP